jgi:hypothetical protein
VATHYQSAVAIGGARERRNLALDVAGVAKVDPTYLDSKGWRHRLDCSELVDSGRGGIPKGRHVRQCRCYLLEQF